MFISKAIIVKSLVSVGGITAASLTITGLTYVLESEVSKINKQLRNLNFPEKCHFQTNTSPITCSIENESTLNKIFSSNPQKANPDQVYSDMELNIKIDKITKEEKDDYNTKEPIKFTFRDFTGEIELEKFNTTLKEGTNPELIINEKGELEMAWTISTFSKKANLNCTEENTSCTFTDQLKIFNSNSQPETLTLPKDLQGTTVNYSKKEENHNQGFKFTISKDLKIDNQVKLEAQKGYEIKHLNGHWGLSEVIAK